MLPSILAHGFSIYPKGSKNDHTINQLLYRDTICYHLIQNPDPAQLDGGCCESPPRHTACCSKRTGTKGSSVTPICYLSCVGHVRPALGSAGAQIPAPSLSCSVTSDQLFNFPRFCFLIRKMGIIKIIRVFTLGLLRGLNEMMHVK